MANKYEIASQNKMDEVAAKFFRPTEVTPIVNEPSIIIPYRYQQWISRITKKQVSWLLSVGSQAPNQQHGNSTKAWGSFIRDGKEYGWEITTIKGGAAQYKVTEILFRVNLTEFGYEIIPLDKE